MKALETNGERKLNFSLAGGAAYYLVETRFTEL
jgi:hypothetical protein